MWSAHFLIPFLSTHTMVTSMGLKKPLQRNEEMQRRLMMVRHKQNKCRWTATESHRLQQGHLAHPMDAVAMCSKLYPLGFGGPPPHTQCSVQFDPRLRCLPWSLVVSILTPVLALPWPRLFKRPPCHSFTTMKEGDTRLRQGRGCRNHEAATLHTTRLQNTAAAVLFPFL